MDRDAIIREALDIYHTMDSMSMEEAMDIAIENASNPEYYDEYQNQPGSYDNDPARDAIVREALDIYHTMDSISMEEAMDIAIENAAQTGYRPYNDPAKESIVQEAIDIYHNYDVSMEQAMDMALEAAANPIASDLNVTLNTSGRVPTAERDYHDLAPGLQRAVMQGILKWIDDYNLLPEGDPARRGLATKIAKAINDPIIRNLMMKSGYWDRVPEEIRMRGLKKAKKFDKIGYKSERKDAKLAYKREKLAHKQNAKTAKYQRKLEAKKAAWESACAYADELRKMYGMSADEALEAALNEMNSYDYDDDYDYEDAYDDYDLYE